MDNQNEIVIYQADEAFQMEVRVENETVWLTQPQMTDLFEKDQSVISRHIRNIFREKELDEKAICIFCIMLFRTNRLLCIASMSSFPSVIA